MCNFSKSNKVEHKINRIIMNNMYNNTLDTNFTLEDLQIMQRLTLDSEANVRYSDSKMFSYLFLFHYTVAFPIVLFCLVSTIRLLKRMRCLTQSDSQELIKDIEKTGKKIEIMAPAIVATAEKSLSGGLVYIDDHLSMPLSVYSDNLLNESGNKTQFERSK